MLFFSLTWKHTHCKAPQPNPHIRTLFFDHICEPSTGALNTPPPVNNHLMETDRTLFHPITVNAPRLLHRISEWVANPSPLVQHAALVPHPNAAGRNNSNMLIIEFELEISLLWWVEKKINSNVFFIMISGAFL